jgi:hypothetical protein
MVSLLGARDDVLRAIERAVPRADVLVRGNEVTLSGPPGEVALVARLFEELLAVVRVGSYSARTRWNALWGCCGSRAWNVRRRY